MTSPPLSTRKLGYAQADKRIQVLQLVAQHGSISQAARAAGISYKAAWQAIHTLTNMAGEPLVEGSVGGAGGGGARLTPAGHRVLEAATQLDAARRDVLARLNRAPDAALTGPRTSMRNLLRARVSGLASDGAGDPMVRVALALGEGAQLAALVTRESAELLDLSPGLALLALCKATAVHIVPANAADAEGPATAGNRLTGRVARVARGHARDEMVLTLGDGQQLVGFCLRPNRLRAGGRALALLDESAVVLALG